METARPKTASTVSDDIHARDIFAQIMDKGF